MLHLCQETQERLAASGGRFLLGLRHRVRVGPGSSHAHPGIELVLHLTGRGHVKLGAGDAIGFGSPSVDVCAPGMPHCQVQVEEGDDLCVTVAVDDGVWGDLPPLLHSDRVSAHMIGEFVALAQQTYIESLLARTSLDLRAAALWLRVLCNVAEETSEGTQAYVHRACGYIVKHLRDAVGPSQLSEHVGVSPRYLRKLFRASLGMSIVDFATQARIHRAQELLSHSSLTVSEIAAEVGYSSAQYMTRVFSQKSGLTPGSYRSHAREGLSD